MCPFFFFLSYFGLLTIAKYLVDETLLFLNVCRERSLSLE